MVHICTKSKQGMRGPLAVYFNSPTRLFMYHNNLVSEKEAWMFVSLTIQHHWKKCGLMHIESMVHPIYLSKHMCLCQHRYIDTYRIDVVNECLLTQVCLLLHDCFAFWIEQTCFGDGHCNTVWVTICWWSSILEVAFLFLGYLAGDADAGAPVGHSCREIFNAGGFMATRETPLVVVSLMGVICTDVFAVIFAQLLDGLFDIPVVRRRCITWKAW